MNRFSIQVICMSLCASFTFSLMLPFAAAATATDVPDMSLTDELIIRNDVISHCFGQNNAVQTTYLQSIDNLIPDGAVLLSEYVYKDNIVFIDYSFGGIRYIVEYFKDGSIRKSSRNPDNNYIQISSTFSSLVETQSIPENNSIIEPSAENSCWDQDTAYPITDISNRASIKRVDPLSYQDDPSTKPYKARVVLEKQVSIPALADAGYSTSQLGRVYETVLETGRNAYNLNIADNGFWNWDPGEFGA